MNDENYILDATLSSKDRGYCYCPVELDKDGNIESIVYGMNLIGFCPGKVIAVTHADGQGAFEEWCRGNPDWREKVEADCSRFNEGKGVEG